MSQYDLSAIFAGHVTRFTVAQLRLMPRPPEYLGELRACAVRVDGKGWHFEEDSACFKGLRQKYSTYVPTAEDLARVELVKAELKVRRDQVTRRLWADLHRRALTTTIINPEVEAAWLRKFDERVPCGECQSHWRRLLKQDPPDLSSPGGYFAWTVLMHNRVNERLGKPTATVEQARERWSRQVDNVLVRLPLSHPPVRIVERHRDAQHPRPAQAPRR